MIDAYRWISGVIQPKVNGWYAVMYRWSSDERTHVGAAQWTSHGWDVAVQIGFYNGPFPDEQSALDWAHGHDPGS